PGTMIHSELLPHLRLPTPIILHPFRLLTILRIVSAYHHVDCGYLLAIVMHKTMSDCLVIYCLLTRLLFTGFFQMRQGSGVVPVRKQEDSQISSGLVVGIKMQHTFHLLLCLLLITRQQFCQAKMITGVSRFGRNG